MTRLSPRRPLGRALGLGSIAGAAVLALAGSAEAAVRVLDAVVTAPPPGAPTASASLVVESADGRPDVLRGASSPDARAVELHAMSMAGGIMRMRPLAGGVPVPAAGRLSLTPASGRHLMIIGPRLPLRAGGSFPVTLEFARSGPVRVAFHVAARPRP